jgi:hypothetical protein
MAGPGSKSGLASTPQSPHHLQLPRSVTCKLAGHVTERRGSCWRVANTSKTVWGARHPIRQLGEWDEEAENDSRTCMKISRGTRSASAGWSFDCCTVDRCSASSALAFSLVAEMGLASCTPSPWQAMRGKSSEKPDPFRGVERNPKITATSTARRKTAKAAFEAPGE